MEAAIDVFSTDKHWGQVQQLLRHLEEAGVSPAMPETEIERLLQNGGLVAIQGGQCRAAAAVHLAEGAVEADLVLITDSNASAQLRSDFHEAVCELASQRGSESLLCYLAEAGDPNRETLGAAGAIEVPGFARWTVQLEVPLQEVPADAFQVIQTDDVDLLLMATKAAWNDLPGHKPATEAAVLEAIEAFGAGNQYVALDSSGRPAGLLRFVLSAPNEGYVDAPGLAPGLREAQNYSSLVRLAMNRLHALGAVTALLDSWGDPPEAAAGWESAGWKRIVHHPARRLVL